MQRKKTRIAIVHPHRDLARAFRSRLELEGFDVVTFETHSVAMSHLSTFAVDLIITSDYTKGIRLRDFIDLVKSLNTLGDMAILALIDDRGSELDSYPNVAYIPKTAANSTTVISGVYDLLGVSAIRR